jgi:hypothetical protein
MTTETSIPAMPTAAWWPRDRSGPTSGPKESGQAFDSAWQQEMERMQAEGWFPGALAPRASAMAGTHGMPPIPSEAHRPLDMEARLDRSLTTAPVAEARSSESGRGQSTVNARTPGREGARPLAAMDLGVDHAAPEVPVSVPVIAVALMSPEQAVAATRSSAQFPPSFPGSAPVDGSAPATVPWAQAGPRAVAGESRSRPMPAPEPAVTEPAALHATPLAWHGDARGLSISAVGSIGVPSFPRGGLGGSAQALSAAVASVAAAPPAVPVVNATAAPAAPQPPNAAFPAPIGFAAGATPLAGSRTAPGSAAPAAPSPLPGAERALAAALPRDAAPRLHLSWDGSAVMVWLGIDGAPDAAALLRTVQRVLRQHGLELSALVCNGRAIVQQRTVVSPAETPHPHEDS